MTMYQLVAFGNVWGYAHTKKYAEMMNKGVGYVCRVEKAPAYVIPPMTIKHEYELTKMFN